MAFPTVVDVASFQNNSTDTTHNVTLPAGIESGMLLVMFVEARGDLSEPTGWTTIAGAAGSMVFSRVASGSEGATEAVTTSILARMVAITYLIDDWTDIEAAAETIGSDPPNLAPTFGSGDNLWIVCQMGRRSDWTHTIPSNYGNDIVAESPTHTATSRLRMASARRELAASSEDPGAFSITGTIDTPVVYTIAVAPAGGAPPNIAPTPTVVSVVSATADVTATSELTPAPTVVAAVSATASVTANLTISPAPTVVTAVSATADVTATTEVSGSATYVTAVSATAQVATIVPAFVWAVIGGATGTAAEVRGELDDTYADPELLVGTASNLAGATPFSGTNTTGDVWTFPLTGLTADTEYHYGFAEGAAFGSFTTAPTGAKSFTICAASCWNEATADTAAIAAIASKNPAIWLPLGDYPYIDNTSEDEAPYLSHWQAMNAVTAIRDLHANTITAYTWSDHDYADNNSNGTDPAGAYAQTAYRKIWPAYTLPGDDGQIHHTFVWGRVRIIMLDCFSNRTPDSSTDNSSKTMLGTNQRAWLLDVLDNATEPLIIINVSEPWIDDTNTYSWGRYTFERAVIAEAIHDAGLDDRVVFIHGDTHQLAWDDGTNNTAGGDWPPGPPVFCFAPLDSSPSSRAGPYSGGEWNDDRTQYGQIDIVDSGGVITATFRGITVDGTETEQFAVALEFGVPEVTPTPTVVTAVSGTADVSATSEIAPTGSVVTAVSATATVSATAEISPTPTTVTAVAGTAQVSATVTITPTPTVVTAVSATAAITGTLTVTPVGTITTAISGTATVTATSELTPSPTVVLVYSATATIAEGEFVYPTVHASTWREPAYASTWREPTHANTYREPSHAPTYRETP